MIINFIYIAQIVKKGQSKTAENQLPNINEELTLNNDKEKEQEKKKKIYIETDESILKRVKIFEDGEKKNKSLKEKEDYYKRLYEQNRENNRERMKNLRQYIKDVKDKTKTSDEFYDELLKYIKKYENDNPEEEGKEKDIFEKYKKLLKIDKQSNNNFAILSEIKKFENIQIDSNNQPESNIFFKKAKKFRKNIIVSNEINDVNIIPDLDEYMKDKIKSYKIDNIKNDNNTIPGYKKEKYTDLIISNNIINITLEKNPKNLLYQNGNYTVNGIPIDEILNSKIRKILERLSEDDKINYQKVEQIYNDINNNKDKNKDIYNNLIKNNFCIECDACFNKANEEQNLQHDEHNIIQLEKNIFNDFDEELNININELDYNDTLNKIYEQLKKDQNKILKYEKNIIISFYSNLLYHLYDIIVNNNCIEDLYRSIVKINELYESDIESQEINSYFKNYFSFYVQRITTLSYYKVKKIEKLMAELLSDNEYNDEFNEETDIFDDVDFEPQKEIKLNNFNSGYKVKRNDIEKIENVFYDKKQLDNEGNKKYFLRLGLDLKFKYGKENCISDLYDKAVEENIEPKYYENFILKELNVFEDKIN